LIISHALAAITPQNSRKGAALGLQADIFIFYDFIMDDRRNFYLNHYSLGLAE